MSQRGQNPWLTHVTAIKTNIFGQLNWSIRQPTKKMAKQLGREIPAGKGDDGIMEVVSKE
jgi:hypothetical protein